MRWDALRVDAEPTAMTLPGLDDGTRVRTFDAPEALDTRFHEVRAGSVLNRVPNGSRMPFAWTVNPYRGCSHACVYCLDPATPVLLADGRTRPIGELEPGDAIVGTRRGARYRRYVTTTVKDRWATRKPAYEVRLADGTRITASGDHRFLTARGWKYVTGAEQGAGRRPHLTVGTRLVGPGAFTEAPEHDETSANRRLGRSAVAEARRLGAITGTAVKQRSRFEVVSIEPVGVRDLVDITTGTGDFVAAGVISHNCFARPTHVHLGMNPGRDFEREIVVKVNAPERLRADLARRGRGAPAPGEAVALGTNTDPYQWVESRYRLMPGIWEALRDARVPSSVLTKSPLLLRDLALMLELRDAAGFEAALSVPSLDERAWRSTEPHTPHPRKRLEAVAELNRAGIPTGVLAAPLMPGINDAPDQVEALLAACSEAGATSVGGIGLHLRGETRDVFLEWLGDARPELVPLYAELYAGGAYLPAGEAQRLRRLITAGERAAPAPSRAARPGTSAGRRWPAPQPAATGGAPPLAPRPPRPPGTTRFDERGRRRVAAARKAAVAEAATARAAEERQQRLF